MNEQSVVGVYTTMSEAEKAVKALERGAKQGAWKGGVFGFLVGSALLLVPEVRPVLVADALASALMGCAEGAVAGTALDGALSGLAAWGISRRQVQKYEEVVKDGKFLVIAHGSAEDVKKAWAILAGTGAFVLTLHGRAA
jgi:hypothetical protein